jgi:hypothetical protein
MKLTLILAIGSLIVNFSLNLFEVTGINFIEQTTLGENRELTTVTAWL